LVGVSISAILYLNNNSNSGGDNHNYLTVHQDDYQAMEITWWESIDNKPVVSMDVGYSMSVVSGPPIDVFFMDNYNFDRYSHKESFNYVSELTCINAKSANLGAKLTSKSNYWIVFDNTDLATAPPHNGLDNAARVQYTLNTLYR